MAADSIPRRVIEYLQGKLPADIADNLNFDTVAHSTKNYPVVVVTACPSIPAVLHGTTIDRTRRTLILYVGLIWDIADDDGRDYEAFQEMMDEIVDALVEMQGKPAIGSRVVTLIVDEDDSVVELNIEEKKYIASVKMKVTYNR